ncbi:MAG: glycosyltransferase family 2 protein [Sediminibacterium sp.]|nr:glycosyltransferase family 2 protein [Sediminibacterium sp.]
MLRLSIITINFNNAKGLDKTLRSVINQSCGSFEYIVIDGGSTDDSIRYLELYSEAIHYQISEPDTGIYHAMNKGIKAATSQYLLFLNSGDYLAAPDVIEKILPQLDSTAIVYGNLILSGEDKTQTVISPSSFGVYELMLSTIWHPTAFIRRDLFLRYGLYNEELSITADYEFFIRCIVRYKQKTKHISTIITVFDLGGVSNNPEWSAKQSRQRALSWELNVTPFRLKLYKLYIWLKRRFLYYTGQL